MPSAVIPVLQPVLEAVAQGADKAVFAERLGEALANPLSVMDLEPVMAAVFGPLEHPLQGTVVAMRNTHTQVSQALDAWCAAHYPNHWAHLVPRAEKPKAVFQRALSDGDWTTLDRLFIERQVTTKVMGTMLNSVVGTGTVQDLEAYADWLRARMPVLRDWWDDAQVQAVKRQAPDLLEAILRQPEAGYTPPAALMIALQEPDRMDLITPLLRALPITGAQQVIQFANVYATRVDAKKISQALPYRHAMDALTALLPHDERPALFARYPGLMPQAEARHQAEIRERHLQARPAAAARSRRTRA